MENMEVLVRGLMMQSHAASMGLGGSLVSLQGVQLQVLWAVVAVATIVVALVSVTRQVSYVSIGWSWGSKSGQVRFSSSLILDDGTSIDSSVFLHSADSCSDDAKSAMFIFENAHLPKQSSAPPGKIVRKRSKSLDFQRTVLFLRSKSFDLQKLESLKLEIVSPPVVLREGIVWEAAAPAAACDVEDSKRISLQSEPRKSASCFDPLWKLRIRDGVFSESAFSVRDVSFPLAPVAVRDGGIAHLGDGVVRVWDSETRRLRRSVVLPKGGGESSAFDVQWGLEAVVMARKDGLLSFVDVESSSAYRSVFQPVVQAARFDSSPSSKTMFIGGPSPADPGCFAALWDSRSSRRELTLELASASAVHGVLSRGVELHVGDEAGSFGVHDVRMLQKTLARVPCESAPEDKWWEMDATLEEGDDVDDDDFMDCQVAEETKRTSMSTLVTVMSRSFSSKALAT